MKASSLQPRGLDCTHSMCSVVCLVLLICAAVSSEEIDLASGVGADLFSGSGAQEPEATASGEGPLATRPPKPGNGHGNAYYELCMTPRS